MGRKERSIIMAMPYSEKVMDHFNNPRNVGELEGADATGTVGNAKCGDIMQVFLKVEDNIIEDVSFQRTFWVVEQRLQLARWLLSLSKGKL